MPNLGLDEASGPDPALSDVGSRLSDPDDPGRPPERGLISTDQPEGLQDRKASMGGSFAVCPIVASEEESGDLIGRHHPMAADPFEDVAIPVGDLVTRALGHLDAS